MAAGQGRAIFISYRRDDSEGEAGRLYDDLVRAYGDDSVFMDVAGIQPGFDFRKAIDSNVASCGVLLAMIGPTWATVTDSGGNRRLDNSSDFVRLEIASALARQIAVIPVLVHDAKMPPLDQLPDDLKDLRYRNSVELTHARWNSDVALLVTALKSYVAANASDATETVHATVPVQLPAPQPSAPAQPAKKSRLPLFLAIAAALVILAVTLVVVLRRPAIAPDASPASTVTAAPATPAPAPAMTERSLAPAPSNPQSASSDTEAALLGKWKNITDPSGGDDLIQLSVVNFGGQIMVQAWGKCPNHPCNWGTKKAVMNGSEAVTESWDLRNTGRETELQRSATLSIHPANGGLQVTVKNIYHQPNGQTKSGFNQVQFEKVP